MLFGPVFFYDVVRLSRRGRYTLLRTLYAGFLGVLLCLVYLNWVAFNEGRRLRATDMASFADSFFATFSYIQFLAVVLLTPAFTAGAVAEEKERQTLEFVLATDLRDREIVLGKLGSRLANLALLLLAGLPILSFLQFLGGVDPGLVLAGFAATAVTGLSLGGLSMLNSVAARRARDAIVLTYLAGVVYLCLSGLSWLLVVPELGITDFPSTDNWQSPVELHDLVEGFNAGNIFSVMARLSSHLASRKDLREVLPEVLRNYAIFHLLVAGVTTGLAMRRLRRQALKETVVKADKKGAVRRRWWRPPVGNQPILWKELHTDAGPRMGWGRRIVVFLLVTASFTPVIIGIITFFLDWSSGGATQWESYAHGMGMTARIVGTMVTCVTLLGVGVRAAGSVSGERDKQTFDALLTTPLDSDAILFGKWLGSILGMCWSWVWAASFIVLGIVTGGLQAVSLPLLFVAWAVYAAFVAALGMWFSVTSRTTTRATVATVLCTVGLTCGHWMLWTCCAPLAFAARGLGEVVDSKVFEYLLMFQSFGLTPPVTLGLLTMQNWEFEHGLNDTHVHMLGCALIGLVVYAVAAGLIGVATSRRFRVVTGREARRQPEGRPSAAKSAAVPDVLDVEPVSDEE